MELGKVVGLSSKFECSSNGITNNFDGRAQVLKLGVFGGGVVQDKIGTRKGLNGGVDVDWGLLCTEGAFSVVGIERVPVEGTSETSIRKLGSSSVAGKQVSVV